MIVINEKLSLSFLSVAYKLQVDHTQFCNLIQLTIFKLHMVSIIEIKSSYKN